MNGDTPVQPASTPPESPWQYRSNGPAAPAQAPQFSQPIPADDGPQEVTWSASEFIDHHKGVGWYAALAAIVVALDVIVFIFTHDIVSLVAITAMGILFGVIAGRKPRTLDYTLNPRGLMLGTAFHSYGEFRSFAIMQDSSFPSIMFLPVKRFMPPVSVYYDPRDQERILDVLGRHLPMEVRRNDAIDNFSRRIRL